MQNSIIDLIIRIKNGYLARKENIEIPYSHMNEETLKKLESLKFIKSFKLEGKKFIAELLYKDNQPAMTDVKIFSRPGRRAYISYKNLKPVLGGFGYSLISTSKGIFTHLEAKKGKLGGELLFSIW